MPWTKTQTIFWTASSPNKSKTETINSTVHMRLPFCLVETYKNKYFWETSNSFQQHYAHLLAFSAHNKQTYTPDFGIHKGHQPLHNVKPNKKKWTHFLHNITPLASTIPSRQAFLKKRRKKKVRNLLDHFNIMLHWHRVPKFNHQRLEESSYPRAQSTVV
jgi:hypothetical protein